MENLLNTFFFNRENKFPGIFVGFQDLVTESYSLLLSSKEKFFDL